MKRAPVSFRAAMALPTLLRRGYKRTVAWLSSADVPAIDAVERVLMSRHQLLQDLFTAVLPPGLLVFAVLGSIIAGIAAPLFLPFLAGYPEFSLVWIAILIAMNLQTSFLTPPFGWSLIFMKGVVAPPDIRTTEI
jgi:TRAP-type mannitol/chloroaromatic compound transport system permease large subunit